MSDQDDLVVREYDEPFTQQDLERQTKAITVRDAVTALDRPAEIKPPVTAAQAKIEAVANLTAAAYAKASELKLTPEEIKALQADFPDDAFKPGAAGKESLIYIEHAFLRDRLNTVIGPGQWAVIPRSRWGEDYKTANGKAATRIYVEAMLMVRGCFVSEAVGEMSYFPHNDSQNYGDAVEGAKTAAFRRCCKEFGIGLQAWKRDWCAGWWQRKNAKPTLQVQPTPRAKAPTATPPGEYGSQSEGVFPVCTVLRIKEVHSKPEAAKPWTVYFVTFTDGVAELEAGTFDKKIADFANELATTGENARLVTKPGKKPGTKEIVSLTRSEVPPGPDSDPVPMEYESEVVP